MNQLQQALAGALQRIAQLERERPTGVGVSSQYGGIQVRPFQMGFPVELTSTWSATTGYSWKQLGLSGVSIATPDVQRTGTNAVPIDGNTSLVSGAKGWLEPDPGAAGYLFITADTTDSGVSGTGTDNRVVRWDGTTAIQDSGVTIDDSANVSTPSTYIATGATYNAILTGYGTALTVDEVGNNYPALSAGLGGAVLIDGTGGRLMVGAPLFSIWIAKSDSTIMVEGLTGTIGPGASATGGLVTDLGSGSYVTTSGSNTFTNQNTFQPATAATVPATVQGAASQTADLLQLKDSGGTLLGGFDAAGVGEFAMDFGSY